MPVSVIGTDLDHIRAGHRLDGVDWSATATRAGRSATFTLTYNKAGELVHLDADYGVAASLTDHALAYIHKGLDHTYHVCCRRPLDIAIVLNALIHNGYPFSIDFMVPSAHQAIATAQYLIHHADPVFVNAAEYDLLTTTTASQTPPTVIVTDGPHPVRLFRHGQLAATVTPPPTTVIEVTGAGDTLTGTFLAARAAGLPHQDALHLATEAATRHVSTPGLALETP